tara:strand:- start:424 stop:738 length:315 start_codon:yes stop_codon:yes gene_type:complete
MKYLNITLRTIIAVLTFLSYSSDIELHTKRRLNFRLIARFYSPFFWAGALLFTIGALIFGGVSKIKPMVKGIKEQFDKDKPVVRLSWATEQNLKPFNKFLLINS